MTGVGNFAPWTDADDATLKRLWPLPALTCAIIAQRLGRSKNAIIGRAYRLGLKPRDNHGQKWTQADCRQLVALRERGLTWRVIGAQIGRTPACCAARYSNLRKRSRAT